VAASHALRASGLSLLQLFESICPQVAENPPRLVHLVDNQAMIAVVRTGRNPAMRHLGRVHGVCIGFLHEQFESRKLAMSYIPTSQMAADIYTTEFTDADKWSKLCQQLGLYTTQEIKAGDLLSLFLSPTDLRSDKRGGNSVYEATAIAAALPSELQGLRTALGYHVNDDGSHHSVVREPKLYRKPSDPSLNMRSTWIRNGPGWAQTEDGVE
jgi:hypothetical protein